MIPLGVLAVLSIAVAVVVKSSRENWTPARLLSNAEDVLITLLAAFLLSFGLRALESRGVFVPISE